MKLAEEQEYLFRILQEMSRGLRGQEWKGSSGARRPEVQPRQCYALEESGPAGTEIRSPTRKEEMQENPGHPTC